MGYDGDTNCCVCNKPIEWGDRGKHHVCDPKLINRLEGIAKRDPPPPTTQNWAARLSQGFRLLNFG